MSYNARPYVLAETNWEQVRDTRYTVAVLPWGATEAHNYHLPYATDNFQADHVAIRAAAKAWEQGARVVVLPCIPFGVNTGQLDIRLCMNLNPSTQLAILRDTCEVLVRSGVEKFVIFNGHGGNYFKQMIRELTPEFPSLLICTTTWVKAAPTSEYFEHHCDHAGEMETSVMLNIAPDLVRPLSEAGDGAARSFKISAFRQGWASTPRAWTQVSKDTGVGDPRLATIEKGQRYLDAVVDKMAHFFVELDRTPNDAMYE